MTANILIHEKMDVVKRYQTEAPVHVVPIANALGMEVFRAKNWPNHVSGMIKKNSDDEYEIYVNADHPVTRRRFTIAHEIAHFILHEKDIGEGIADDALYRSGLSNTMEAEANRLAASILMPWSLLDPILARSSVDINVRQLARAFDVSPSAMSIRLGIPAEDAFTRQFLEENPSDVLEF